MKIIFLGIDGVLNNPKFINYCNSRNIHPNDQIDPAAVYYLNKLTDATKASIVIASNWRITYLLSNNLTGLISLLKKHKVTGNIIGMTPDHNMINSRKHEINDWICRATLDGLFIESHILLDNSSIKHGLQLRHVKNTIEYFSISSILYI
jgi:hypothetical protein